MTIDVSLDAIRHISSVDQPGGLRRLLLCVMYVQSSCGKIAR